MKCFLCVSPHGTKVHIWADDVVASLEDSYHAPMLLMKQAEGEVPNIVARVPASWLIMVDETNEPGPAR